MSEPVTVRFAGSGDAFGSGGRFQACVHVEAGATRFLLDCGTTSLAALKRLGLDPQAVDTILVTHLHGDHFGGLPFYLLDAQFAKRTEPLTIAGPPGIEARVRAAQEVLFPGSSATVQRFEVRFVELAGRRPVEIGGLRVTPFEVVHASGAPPFALRVEIAGRVITCSGDTEWTEALVDASREADLFICEAYTFDKRVRYHLDHATLAAHRSELTCKRLILTHMGPDMLPHLPQAQAETAHDGLVITL